MSYTVEKELLRPGRYFPPGGPVDFSIEELRAYCENTNRLLASNRQIPVPFEHQDDAVPLSHADVLANRVKHNAGWLKECFFKDDGSLWGKLEFDDPAIYGRLPSIKFVSPEFRHRFECDGTVHKNVITHVALTTQPVWRDQTPFHVPSNWMGDDGAMQILPSNDRLSLNGTLRMSLAYAEASPETQSILQFAFAYRVPEGGLWFRGKFYRNYVPKAAIEEAEAANAQDDVEDLLRKIALRTKRATTRAYAGRHEPKPRELTAEEAQVQSGVHMVPHTSLQVTHPALKKDFLNFEDDVILVWEDPKDGLTHVVHGHDLLPDPLVHDVKDESFDMPVMRITARDPEEARAVAAMYALGRGKLGSKGAAWLMRLTGATVDQVYEEFKAADVPVSRAKIQKAYDLAGLDDQRFSRFLAGDLDEEDAHKIATHEDVKPDDIPEPGQEKSQGEKGDTEAAKDEATAESDLGFQTQPEIPPLEGGTSSLRMDDYLNDYLGTQDTPSYQMPSEPAAPEPALREEPGPEVPGRELDFADLLDAMTSPLDDSEGEIPPEAPAAETPAPEPAKDPKFKRRKLGGTYRMETDKGVYEVKKTEDRGEKVWELIGPDGKRISTHDTTKEAQEKGLKAYKGHWPEVRSASEEFAANEAEARQRLQEAAASRLAEQARQRPELSQEWLDKAREAGIDPEHLSSLASEMMRVNNEVLASRIKMLRHAREAGKALGHNYAGLPMRAAHGRLDAAGVPGLDDVAKTMHSTYPEHFSGVDETAAADHLFSMMSRAQEKPTTLEQALQSAFDHLEQKKAEQEVPGDVAAEQEGGDTSFDTSAMGDGSPIEPPPLESNTEAPEPDLSTPDAAAASDSPQWEEKSPGVFAMLWQGHPVTVRRAARKLSGKWDIYIGNNKVHSVKGLNNAKEAALDRAAAHVLGNGPGDATEWSEPKKEKKSATEKEGEAQAASAAAAGAAAADDPASGGNDPPPAGRKVRPTLAGRKPKDSPIAGVSMPVYQAAQRKLKDEHLPAFFAKHGAVKKGSLLASPLAKWLKENPDHARTDAPVQDSPYEAPVVPEPEELESQVAAADTEALADMDEPLPPIDPNMYAAMQKHVPEHLQKAYRRHHLEVYGKKKATREAAMERAKAFVFGQASEPDKISLEIEDSVPEKQRKDFFDYLARSHVGVGSHKEVPALWEEYKEYEQSHKDARGARQHLGPPSRRPSMSDSGFDYSSLPDGKQKRLLKDFSERALFSPHRIEREMAGRVKDAEELGLWLQDHKHPFAANVKSTGKAADAAYDAVVDHARQNLNHADAARIIKKVRLGHDHLEGIEDYQHLSHPDPQERRKDLSPEAQKYRAMADHHFNISASNIFPGLAEHADAMEDTPTTTNPPSGKPLHGGGTSLSLAARRVSVIKYLTKRFVVV